LVKQVACRPGSVDRRWLVGGVQNVLTKSIGTKNPHNVIKATFDALIQLRNKAEVATLRGKAEEEL
jgi:small subunit ribosomal protein S5